MNSNFKFSLRDVLRAKQIFNSNSSVGFSMVETIIAVSVLLFGVVLVYSAFSATVALTYNIPLRFTAEYLAQEGLEIVRNIRDNNVIQGVAWSQGLAQGVCTTGCIADYKIQDANQLAAYADNSFLGLNADHFYSYDPGAAPTIFKRKITITPVSDTPDAISVDVAIVWDYNGKSFSYDVREYLYNWR